MAGNYANAKDVLPPELLEAVQRHHTGHLWIPPNAAEKVKERQEARDARIVTLRAEGLSSREIAARMGLSERRVWQILVERSRPKLLKVTVRVFGWAPASVGALCAARVVSCMQDPAASRRSY